MSEKCYCGTEKEIIRYSVNEAFGDRRRAIYQKEFSHCPKCSPKIHFEIGDTIFCRVENKLFYDLNLDCGITDALGEVCGYKHFLWLKNERKESEYLQGVEWK